MKNRKSKSLLSLLLCLALLAAAALSVTAAAETATQTRSEYVIPASENAEETVILLNGTREAPVVLGDGKTAFLFKTVDPDGNESWFEIHTDKTTLADALLEQQLISGSDSEYGLMVDTVCGLQLIWSEENPHYWALYENGEYAQVGASSIEIKPETVYAFIAE